MLLTASGVAELGAAFPYRPLSTLTHVATKRAGSGGARDTGQASGPDPATRTCHKPASSNFKSYLIVATCAVVLTNITQWELVSI
jgi:hypothetical protein